MDEESQIKETVRMTFEVFKHLTTLCTGTILILFAVLEQSGDKATHPWPFRIAIGLFLLSLLTAILSMFFTATFYAQRWPEAPERWNIIRKSQGWIIAVAMLSYFAALLGVSAWINI
jgi:hypothetical protein